MDNTWNAKKIMTEFSRNALHGNKIPHGVSNPVFRKADNGEYVACAFIYLYNANELKEKRVKRPSRWISFNLHSGDIVEYDCRERDFSEYPMDMVCDLQAEDDTVFSAEYQKQTLAVFDLILRKYMITGRFDSELNDAYMYMMTRMVSVGFKSFYKDLNKI